MGLLRHNRQAPIRKDGGLTYEWLQNNCKQGRKKDFYQTLLACLNPEKGNVRYQVQLLPDMSIVRVRAIQGHTIPGVSADGLGYRLITCGTRAGDERRGHGEDHPSARTIIHGTKATSRDRS